MNEGLTERFGRSRRVFRPEPGRDVAEVCIQPPQLNLKVREYFEDAKRAVEGGSWLLRPEIPSAAEILDIDETGSDSSSTCVEIVPNKPKGAWESKGTSNVTALTFDPNASEADGHSIEAYLGAQYELLREDAVRMLREAVSLVRVTPDAKEDAFNGKIGLYEKVHVCGMICSGRGVAIRVTFSLSRVGKQIRWEQSKRLITGGLVVLTPAKDMFQSKAIVATVAARPISGALDRNPPEIDLFIRADELELDPTVEWVMVEERQGFYEAHRHTLMGLQKMTRERFPLAEHIVEVNPTVLSPQHVVDNPLADLTSVLRNNRHETYEKIHMLKHWPAQPSSDMDASQLAALRRMLTKKLAIIQGPPGCGKTYVSVQAIRVMLANHKPKDPPIILACQTNHAIDQLLRHVAEFEKDFVRLGGMSKEKEVIKPRTLYEVRQSESRDNVAGCFKQNARRKMKDLEKEFILLLSPLEPTKIPLDFRMLEKFGLLTPKQADTLESGASEWVQDKKTNVTDARTSPFTVWLTKTLIAVPPKQKPELYEFPLEEADLGFEQLKELEAENMAKDDEDFDTLRGLRLPLADNFTCRKVTGVTAAKVKDLLKQQDMWKIPEAMRGEVYRYLQGELKNQLLTGFREKAKFFNEQAGKRRIGQFEEDEIILKEQKVIGMTTTGFSKYRALLSALQPKIVLIEEAAETLEAPVTVTCLASVQQLILVGDHKQLRPHCHVKALEAPEYSFNISLFERMIENGIDFDMLAKQRRMIPEIRRILYPIYGDKIKDHPSVLDSAKRPNVPGMGGINSCFFSHDWPEQRDDQMSALNKSEAEMVVGMAEYLVCNGVAGREITILTFYNGQRRYLLRLLGASPVLVGNKPVVVTVDSYQGEENRIVLLSLVRSNEHGQVGFLDVDNRVCVALSRAQCGFYIFGNGALLYDRKTKKGQKNTWRAILDILAGTKQIKDRPTFQPTRLFNHLPITCSNHGTQTQVADPSDWQTVNGGCTRECDGHLPCGHPCLLKCHPYGHDEVPCQQQCGKMLPCGHACEKNCGDVCSCAQCKPKRPVDTTNFPRKHHVEYDGQERLSRTSSTESWKLFAKEENVRYNIAASAPPSNNTSPQKPLRLEPVDEKLLDLDEEVTPRLSKLLMSQMDGTSEGSGRTITQNLYERGGGAHSDDRKGKMKHEECGGGNLIVVDEETKSHAKDWSKEHSLLD
ncbi:hypothetical protein LTR78_003127 [Recurvomyces mirabilis]|uniref:P-loop containing nucleoside triphosphate hydrolase protein n=1 Tax=Recurvomyces mirabilis TaxID=574656 RepID=A0AAE1C3M1_9PEZI|nr:hypothetical protein LTR78_003127 [Recurvomyces mirabilis]KAK5157051.1 hypothetical protein LTS14_004569 [Recurvomyces mirabilis]